MNTLEYYKVDIKLKPSQFAGENKWRYTYQGEERLSTMPHVCWYVRFYGEAIRSFNISELLSFSIEGDFTRTDELVHKFLTQKPTP